MLMDGCTRTCCVFDHTQHISAPPLLVFADDWGRHPSSCQHLVLRLQRDFPILWANSIGTRRLKANAFTVKRAWEKLKSWNEGLRQVADQMWVIDLPMLPDVGGPLSREINRRLVTARLMRVINQLALDAPIVMTTLPYIGPMVRSLPRRSLVYYCTDDYSFWPDAQRDAVQRAEQELSREADLVIGVSHALVARLSKSTPCRYLPHGVDLDHFGSVGEAGPVPAVLAGLPGRKIGFFGLIYEKLDFGLLSLLAESFSDDSLVMIGRVDSCPESFRRVRNVHLIGPQPYQELPRWLAGLDVLLLPYVDDEMIRQSSPLKLRECLASGKPTVSVDVPEARLLEPHVRVARDYGEFIAHVQRALDEPADSTQASARRNAVACDDWNRRAEELRALLYTAALG